MFVVVGVALAHRAWPMSFGDAIARVVDGDADRREWTRCLRVLRDAGLRRAELGEIHAGRVAASAAVLLGDADGYRAACRALHRHAGVPEELPGAGGLARPGDAVVEALGEAMLQRFFEGNAAEARGDVTTARARYEQVAAAAFLRHSELMASIAAAALARVP